MGAISRRDGSVRRGVRWACTLSAHACRARATGAGARIKIGMASITQRESSRWQAKVRRWLWTYNYERPNMALGGITPMQKLALAA